MSEPKTSAVKKPGKTPLVLLRPDATDEELQRACDVLNAARRQWLEAHPDADRINHSGRRRPAPD